MEPSKVVQLQILLSKKSGFSWSNLHPLDNSLQKKGIKE